MKYEVASCLSLSMRRTSLEYIFFYPFQMSFRSSLWSLCGNIHCFWRFLQNDSQFLSDNLTLFYNNIFFHVNIVLSLYDNIYTFLLKILSKFLFFLLKYLTTFKFLFYFFWKFRNFWSCFICINWHLKGFIEVFLGFFSIFPDFSKIS